MKTNGVQENIVWKAVLLMKIYFPVISVIGLSIYIYI